MSSHPFRLILMGLLHFLIMYALMYSMVDRIDNVVPNLNNAYMAALMTAPMLILEVLLMGFMYGGALFRRIILLLGIIILIAGFIFIREQFFIRDSEFVRSMIPHHSGAILMCEKATLTDAGLRQLCSQIIESQQREINLMKQILPRLKE